LADNGRRCVNPNLEQIKRRRAMENGTENRKPYVEPTLEKCEKLVEITEGVGPIVSGIRKT
jgi:hypothetical protein